MIDLDPALKAASESVTSGERPTGWSVDEAESLARSAAERHDLSLQWERGDEEWILFVDNGSYCGMISVRIPIALFTHPQDDTFRAEWSHVQVVRITDFLEEDLRSSPDVLTETVLPDGWNDDFYPDHFCANDLFVESV